MLIDQCLPKFDIHQGIVAPSWFKNHSNSRKKIFQKKKVLSGFRSEIHVIVPRNILSTGQSVRALKKSYSGLH